MVLADILMAVLFVASSGILFHEKFRTNKVMIAITGTIALVSTYLLLVQIPAIQIWMASFAVGKPPITAGPTPSPGPVVAPTPQVQPAVEAVTEAEARGVLDDYLGAWQRGDVASQTALLADDFHYVDQNKWQSRADYVAQKERLARNYLARGAITVTPEYVRITTTADGATVQYIQHYRSAGYWSDGINIFTMRKVDGRLKITEERFTKTASGEPS